MDPDTVLSAIQDIASKRVSGELIFARDDFEVHVYFQKGRIAWANDAHRRGVFSRHIQLLANIPDDVWHDVLNECVANRLPVGETLIDWGLATHEQVRASLRLQINDALGQLWAGKATKSLFLQRETQYSSYRRDLTFEVGELVALRFWKGEGSVSTASMSLAAIHKAARSTLLVSRDEIAKYK